MPVVLSILLTLMMLLWTRHLIRRSQNPSPLLKAYYVNFRVSLVSDSFILLAFLGGYLLSAAGLPYLSLRVDPLLSVILSLYMLWVGFPLLMDNFRSLADLPLPEKDMLKILRVVTEFHEEYTGFGMLFSRQSGKQKIVELELFFEKSVTIEEIGLMEQRMTSRLGEMIPEVKFRILPRTNHKIS